MSNSSRSLGGLALAAAALSLACAAAEPRLPASIPAATGEWRSTGGVRYLDVREGTGPAVQPRRCAYVHYSGWLMDGRRFDTSREAPPLSPAEPIGFQVGTRQVIEGWDIGLQGMRVGGQRRLLLPPRVAYGEQGAPPEIPPRATLVFDLEVMGVADALPAPPGTPAGCPPWKAISRES